MEISDSLKEIIIGYYEGSLNQSQAEELLSWTGKSKENLEYFRQIGEIWHASASLSDVVNEKKQAWHDIEERITTRDYRKLPAREIRIPLLSLIRIAASLLILVSMGVAGFVVFNKNKHKVITAQYIETSAPKGSRSMILLPDSTVVWLNAGTTFRYPVDYGVFSRQVHLKGEAYFKVKKNKKLPFTVNTSAITVTALGTAFNVKAYDDENTIETTLEEGSVKIDLKSKTNKAATFKPVVLKPKQNAVFQKQSGSFLLNSDNSKQSTQAPRLNKTDVLPVAVKDVPDTRIYTSWKDTRWIFKNESLGSLAPKLERRYDVKITFINTDLKDYAFSGILLEESLEQVLTALQLAAPVTFEIQGKEVKLYANKGALDYYNKHRN